MKSLVMMLSALLLIAGSGVALAAPLVGAYDSPAETPYLLQISAKCSRLISRGGRETIVNTCDTCRVVGIIRKRPGIPAPVRRELTVQALSKIQVPFRGPGHSRITSDIRCKGQPNSGPKLPTSQANTKCVQLEQRAVGVVLVNSCGTCRGVAVQRMNKAGLSLGLQAYKLYPKAVARVASKGAAQVTISGEVACPK